MALFPLRLPPGIVRNGTEYGSKGRYYDANLIRWTEDGTLKPVGGWRLRSGDTVDGKARACLAWKDNNGVSWLGIGTHTGLFVQNRSGDVYDITPDGFDEGRADAESAGGYGDGGYGDGTYGTPRPDVAVIQPASQWTLDSWGENLVGVMAEDGKIYEWTLEPDDAAEEIVEAPACKALVVTPEGFLFALGTDDNPRNVAWCDQRNNTLWVPDADNQAGDFPLQTQGALMCGKVVKGGTLLFTDQDVHLASYIGGTSVYGFDRIGTACGAVSRQCVAAIDAQAVWMGISSFWIYNGYIQPLACDVLDYVFSDFNREQASKVYAVRDSANSEVLFYYCSASSLEIDRCAVWNYKANHWNIGRAPRLCGTDRGVFTYPIFVDAGGAIHEHEVGLSYDGAAPYAEGGPIEIGEGDRVMRAGKLIPDEKTVGDVTATFLVRFAPGGAEQMFGPYALSDQTDVRFEARQVKLRYAGSVLSDWRVGTARLEVTAGGRR
jgi:hypothetical protein